MKDVTINGRSLRDDLESMLKNIPSWVPPEMVAVVAEASEELGSSTDHIGRGICQRCNQPVAWSLKAYGKKVPHCGCGGTVNVTPWIKVAE